MQTALALNRNRFDCVIHLGDGCKEFELLSENHPSIPFVSVYGNCDGITYKNTPVETALDLEGHRLLLCHGHRCNVKSRLDTVGCKALEKDCDILLFGHTHIPYSQYIPESEGQKALYLFNPGSISRPHFGCKPSYGTLELTEKTVLFNHGYINI